MDAHQVFRSDGTVACLQTSGERRDCCRVPVHPRTLNTVASRPGPVEEVHKGF
jgi:hypothetical protein